MKHSKLRGPLSSEFLHLIILDVSERKYYKEKKCSYLKGVDDMVYVTVYHDIFCGKIHFQKNKNILRNYKWALARKEGLC